MRRQAEQITARHAARQTSYRPHGDNTEYREAKTAITGAQVASDAAANAAVPGAGIVLKGVRSFGDASQETRRAGATVGQQVAYGALTAGKDVVIEKTFDGLAGT